MKKQIHRRMLRIMCRFMAAIMLLTPLVDLVRTPLVSVAKEVAVEADYEAKKAVYREKLMADDVTTDDFLIGSWVSFYPFFIDKYEYQLDQMAAAGINFNIFPRDFGEGKMFDAAYWENIEAQYAERNMVYMMNGSKSEITMSDGIEYAADKEHCIGYHLDDEPEGSELEALGTLMRAYREADNSRYPYVNLFPSYAGPARLGGTYRQHVEQYVAAAGAENIEYLSHDFYPFNASGNNLEIFADMEVLRSVAYENGKLKTHAFGQSSAWNWARMPNIDEMRWNVYGYLAYGFKALSWFNLVCPGTSDTEGEGFYESLIYRDGEIHDPALFEAWSELNWEIRGLSDALMNLDTVHAYHTSGRLEGVEYLPGDFFLIPDGEMDFVISLMEAKDGTEPYVMLFNKSLKEAREAVFFVDPASGIEGVEYLDPHTGEYIPMDISDGCLEDYFEIGQGKLYRLKGNVKMGESLQAPLVDVEGGRYTQPVTVSITSADEDGVVYYTLDGSYPTAGSILYTGPITLGKEGQSSFHTLRAANIKGDIIGDAVTCHYIIDSLTVDGADSHNLADTNADNIMTVGDWSVSNGKISITGGAEEKNLNYYADTSVVYGDFIAAATLRFDGECDEYASAGILLKAVEGDEFLYVGITRRGTLYVLCNGRGVRQPDISEAFVDVSKEFDLLVTLSGNHLRIESGGQLLAESVSEDYSISGYLGLNTDQGGVFTAENVCFEPLSENAPVLETAITKLQAKGTSVSVDVGTSPEKIMEQLEKKTKGWDESGESDNYDIVWDLENVDISSPGIYLVKGYPVLDENGTVVNPKGKATCAVVKICHEPEGSDGNPDMNATVGTDDKENTDEKNQSSADGTADTAESGIKENAGFFVIGLCALLLIAAAIILYKKKG